MTAATFRATHQWQDVPNDAIVPPGLHIRMDPNTGLRQARIPTNGADPDGLDDDYAADAGPTAPPVNGAGQPQQTQQQQPKPPDPLTILRPTSWQGLPVPERAWHVRDWIPDRQVSALYGDGGTGKSLLAQQLLTATAIGAPWLGLQTKHCRAIGVFCEDHQDELHIRQDAINSAYGCDYRDLAGLELISRVGFDNLLMTFSQGVGDLTAFFDQILAWSKAFGANFAVIDTAADTFGGNENARPEVRQFIQAALGRLAREINGAVLLCAHPSRSGLASGKGDGGSTGWSNSVRSRMHLYVPQAEGEAERDTDARILELPKANYAAMGSMMKLRWTEGTLQPDEKIDGSTPGMMGNIERERAERVFLDLLNRTIAEGRRVSPAKQTPNYAPKAIARMADRHGFTVLELQQAMERLFQKGRIKAFKYNRFGSLEIVPCDPVEQELNELDELARGGRDAA